MSNTTHQQTPAAKNKENNKRQLEKINQQIHDLNYKDISQNLSFNRVKNSSEDIEEGLKLAKKIQKTIDTYQNENDISSRASFQT